MAAYLLLPPCSYRAPVWDSGRCALVRQDSQARRLCTQAQFSRRSRSAQPERCGCSRLAQRPRPAPGPCSALTSPEQTATPQADFGGGGSGNRGSSRVGTGGGGPSDDGKNDKDEEDELLGLSQVENLAASQGVKLPADFINAATSGGLRKSALLAYLNLQGSWLTGLLARTVPAARDRLIADHRFLFLVVAEMTIDSGCATVAEVRKRGKDFWAEFEFYLSDLLVGLVMDIVLVSLMAPVASIGAKSRSRGTGRLQQALSRVPSAVFESSTPGNPHYSVGSRVACVGVKFLEYSLAGMLCGLVGQGIANGLMQWKRHTYGAKDDDVAIPPLGMTALTWGLFMGVSSNLRYQAVFGLERVVDRTFAASVPRVAYLTSALLRFGNNIVGGEQFVDLARWTGVQAYSPDE